ncbi:hypothetical protein MM236_19080 [Belliella sp. DSM 107340]|uniref:Uncharacterized protein n=1 Tax=Belliella calami TaxID=2923436 RepID=A0ABS9UU01_9BACT|nr:hypothetical protein [Belliella calami]MCH7400107.1 hypothetical protein [Belliella calami]
MKAVRRIHFEDQGQDFLSWDLDRLDEVVGCEPFQGSVWIGCVVITDSESGLLEGDRPHFVNKIGNLRQLKYKIERIEELKDHD